MLGKRAARGNVRRAAPRNLSHRGRASPLHRRLRDRSPQERTRGTEPARGRPRPLARSFAAGARGTGRSVHRRRPAHPLADRSIAQGTAQGFRARQVPAAPRARRWGHEHRLSGGTRHAAEQGGDQGAPPEAGRAVLVPRPLRTRGTACGPAQPSEHRAHVRPRHVRLDPLHRHGIRGRGGSACQGEARRAARDPRRRRLHPPGGARAPERPRGGARPPRHQAGEPRARQARCRQDPRSRPGLRRRFGGRVADPDVRREGARHGGLPVAGAGPRQPSRRRPLRHLRPRLHAVLRPHRPRPLRQGNAGGADPGPDEAAAAEHPRGAGRRAAGDRGVVLPHAGEASRCPAADGPRSGRFAGGLAWAGERPGPTRPATAAAARPPAARGGRIRLVGDRQPRAGTRHGAGVEFQRHPRRETAAGTEW